MINFNRYESILLLVIIGFLIYKININELFSQRTKCFSCEEESDTPHPSSCYSCEDQENNILLNRFPQRMG